MDYSLLLPTLHVATGGAAIACVLYTIQGNCKPRINKLFLILGASLLVWCIGLAVQSVGATASIRYIGSRVAPLGYAAMFAVLLHYVLLLTGHERLAEKWWILPLIYLPGLVTIYGFTVYPLIFRLTDTMYPTRMGWVNMTVNGWVVFFYFYYAIFFIATMLLLIRWSKKAPTEKKRRQARLLAGALWVGIILGSVTDVALVLVNIRMPGVASIFALLPIIAISYSVKQYGFMQPESGDANEIIMDRSNRTRVYQLIGLCFLGGSLLNILSQHLLYQETGLPSAWLFSGILLIIGVGVLILGRLHLPELFKELLFAMIFSLVIPLITLRFVVYASITVWTFFFLLLMISLLFNKRILLSSVLISAVLTQLLVWSITPQAHVTLDAADYMIRTGLIELTAAMSLYINRIYRRRLQANAEHAYQQKMVFEISQSLASVDDRNLDEKIVQVLAQCGTFLRCERADLLLLDESPEAVYDHHEWVSGDTPVMPPICKKSMALFCRRMRERFPNRPILAFSDLENRPPRAGGDRVPFAAMGIKGFVFLPIVKNGKDLGFLCFSFAAAERERAQDPPRILSIIVNTLADTVAKLEDMRKIEWSAYHDHLTGLPNRFLFRSRLNQAIERAGSENTPIGVAFIDLDSFKSINDAMGHEVGDRLLKEIANAIARQVKEPDTVARFGGDEFVLLLEQMSGEAELVRAVQDILDAVRQPVILQSQEFFVTASIGVALYPHDGTDADTLIKNADIAMYDAKSLGKNRYTLCSQLLKDKAKESAELTNLLYRALDKQQLTLHYQPQISLETGAIVGLEALLRWNLPGRGLVSPTVFIPLAEQTGLIQTIGAWVLENACRQNRKWQSMGFPPVRMAVNISVQQIQNRGFVQQVGDVLKKTGLPPEFLELEVTESVANSGADSMVDLMARLKALGVTLSIDDFGTEYSSLERLKLLPIDRIKMDMQFVQGIESSDKDRAIAQVIINLAKSLDLKVIAEGVETDTQLDFLNQRMCDEVQGYYYFRPMPPEEIEKIFKNGIRFGQAALEPVCAPGQLVPAGAGGVR